MDENELTAIVEARLAARLEERQRADREKMRIEVVMELRREAERRHYDKINSKHPIEDKYSGLGKAGHEARLRQMDANRAAANAHMDEVQARPVEGSLEHRRRVALTPGSEGFRLKG